MLKTDNLLWATLKHDGTDGTDGTHNCFEDVRRATGAAYSNR